MAPPADDADSESIFLPQIDGYTRESIDEQTAVPDLEITATARHAVYRADASQIDLYLYPMTASEADAVFHRVQRIYDAESSAGGSRAWSMMRLNDYAREYVHTDGLGQNHLWFVKNWLLVLRTRGAEDREEFLKSFLRASCTEELLRLLRDQPNPPE